MTHAIVKSIRFFFVLILCSTLMLGDSSGPLSGTGAGTWTTPANVSASDNVYATKSIGIDSLSPSLSISTLGFALPAGATVSGIEATFEHKCSGASSCNTDTAFGGVIKLTKTAATGQGTNKGSATFWGTSDSTDTLGSSSDLWGSTWTATEVNATGFGLVVFVHNDSASGSRTASVDYMALTVYYTPSGSGSHRRVIISQTRTVAVHS